MSDDPIVYLAAAPNEVLARMWAEVLEEAGIRSLIKASGPGVGAWASAAMMEHEIYVLESRRAEAEAIIDELEATSEGEAADDGEEWSDGPPP